MGGSAHSWTAIVRSRLVPGSGVGLRLVMTKFGPPAVRIAYTIGIEPLPR